MSFLCLVLFFGVRSIFSIDKGAMVQMVLLGSSSGGYFDNENCDIPFLIRSTSIDSCINFEEIAPLGGVTPNNISARRSGNCQENYPNITYLLFLGDFFSQKYCKDFEFTASQEPYNCLKIYASIYNTVLCEGISSDAAEYEKMNYYLLANNSEECYLTGEKDYVYEEETYEVRMNYCIGLNFSGEISSSYYECHEDGIVVKNWENNLNCSGEYVSTVLKKDDCTNFSPDLFMYKDLIDSFAGIGIILTPHTKLISTPCGDDTDDDIDDLDDSDEDSKDDDNQDDSDDSDIEVGGGFVSGVFEVLLVLIILFL